MPVRLEHTDPEHLARWAASRRRMGGRIRQLRLAAGLTQEQVALRAGMSRNHFIAVKHGQAGLLFERLDDLAASLGACGADLLAEPHPTE